LKSFHIEDGFRYFRNLQNSTIDSGSFVRNKTLNRVSSNVVATSSVRIVRTAWPSTTQVRNTIAAAAKFPSLLGTTIKLERIQIQMSLGRAIAEGAGIEIQRILRSAKRKGGKRDRAKKKPGDEKERAAGSKGERKVERSRRERDRAEEDRWYGKDGPQK